MGMRSRQKFINGLFSASVSMIALSKAIDKTIADEKERKVKDDTEQSRKVSQSAK